ncbi:hypothetical protein Chor_010184, partial [Crotalus horridus]
FDRGKDDASQNKDDPSQSMSKSKVQKKNYREEKKRATKELLSTITDPSDIVMADWLKIRGTLKSWTKLWCVLKPGVLLIYKTPKNGQWVGTVLLNACELIERPSKKDGFCFKLFHPLEQSIWAVKGPKGEAVGSITQPLPSSYLIIRAASESDGRCWMDALELALKCSSLLKRTMIREGKEHELNLADSTHVSFYGLLRANNVHSTESFPLNDSEIERHFKDSDMYSDKSDRENDHDRDESDNDGLVESDTDTSERQDDSYIDPEPDHVKETIYIEEGSEELGEAGEASQTEIVSEENKSLIWTLLKQVRPGMDLSKVVLPTFILETRSFLDKLSDYYYHADFLSEAALEENAYNRMKKVVKWYLSGFYKKPKGLKKPYNPILGETFRCLWIHPKTNSKTFYIAEQVSHHPPISAFYVSNRKDGFCLSANILAKSKFYGNSLSAILDGEGRLMFLNRGEDYVMTMPYAHCKGILYGTMTLELGGTVSITCEKTGYSAVLEFKLKDSEVIIRDKKTDASETFWNPTPEIRQHRLRRYTVKFEEQGDFESENTRPWDPLNDMIQFEKDGIIQTKVRHRTPMVTVAKIKRSAKSKKEECGFSSPEPDNPDSSGSEAQLKHNTRIRKKTVDLAELQSAIESIKLTQEDIRRDITALRTRMTSSLPTPDNNFFQFKHYVFILLMVLLQLIINYLFK